jgi:hypothetical protein
MWYQSIQPPTTDAWSFYMSLGPLSNAGQYYGEDNFFWHQLVEHPNYDEFWQQRNILPHLKNVKTNVMTVGGWFDAEDLYGPLHIYRELERHNPNIYNTLVMGPWGHGDWASNAAANLVGKVSFGENISDFYQREIEAPFFRHFLKGEGQPREFEAMMFDTGQRKWFICKQWPPLAALSAKYYLQPRRLTQTEPDRTTSPYSEFISDPADPVPYRQRSEIVIRFTPREYMTDDQRFASERPDVLVFETPPLERDLTWTGDIMAILNVSTTGTDADWAVKLIDVYPENYQPIPGSRGDIDWGGYQQMVRSEVIRGRFRNSYENPEPFVPGQITTVKLPLQDVYHTFKAGHRIMIHVQSTWFPLIDRNPQKYVDNIFKARAEDFVSATHRVYHSAEHPSWIEFKMLPQNPPLR